MELSKEEWTNYGQKWECDWMPILLQTWDEIPSFNL